MVQDKTSPSGSTTDLLLPLRLSPGRSLLASPSPLCSLRTSARTTARTPSTRSTLAHETALVLRHP
jgi:hypothetical protein